MRIKKLLKDEEALGLLGGSLAGLTGICAGLPGYICNLTPLGLFCCAPTCFGLATSAICGGGGAIIGTITGWIGDIVAALGSLAMGGTEKFFKVR
jgi:hypothetical protein